MLADESTYLAANEKEMPGVPADVKAAMQSAAKARNMPKDVYANKNTRSAVDPIRIFLSPPTTQSGHSGLCRCTDADYR